MEKGNVEGVRKNKLITVLLCCITGFLGAHRFYAGQGASGGIMLFMFLGGICIPYIRPASFIPFGLLSVLFLWIIVDLVLILCNKMEDVNGRKISNWT
jgi:TM2 domain-containing membrane protein YozV